MSSNATADADSITVAFKALPTNEARRSALQSILAELRPAEWRDLQQQTNARTFQYDVFGSLPVELAAQICSYLDPVDIISSRRVSKRWKELTSLPLSCSVAFRHLHPHSPLDTSNPQWGTHFTQRAKQQHAVNTGRPYSKATFPIDEESFGAIETKKQYCDGKLAWCSYTRVVVFCLKTGRETSFTTENRESIKDIRISESIIAAISTRSVCHVWNLRDGQTRNFRLPSLNINHFVVSGHKVIMHFFPTGSLLVWDYETQAVMETPLSERPDAIVFNRAINSLSVIHFNEFSNANKSRYLGVTLFQYSITGTNIYQSAPPALILRGYPIERFRIPDRSISTPYVIVILSLSTSLDPPPPFSNQQVLFDFSSGLSEPLVHTSWDVNKDLVTLPQFFSVRQRVITMPGGVIYQQTIPGLTGSDEVIPSEIVVDVYKCSEIASIERELYPDKESKNWASLYNDDGHSSYRASTQIFGDGEFLCMEYEKSVIAFCFDENVSMPREDPGYREIRNRRVEQRAQLRRECAQ